MSTERVLRGSSLDFVDLHAYPGSEEWPSIASRFRLAGIKAKPVVLGEFGAFKRNTPSVKDAATILQRWQVESCSLGFDGWLVWTWGSGDAKDDLWGAVAGSGEVDHALAPAVRPDPCKPGAEIQADPNLAFHAKVTASNTESEAYGARKAVDESMDSWWSAGAGPPQWIQIDLGGSRSIGAVKLYLGWVAPIGHHIDRVWVKGPSTGGVFRLVHEFDAVVRHRQVLTYRPASPLNGIRYVKIETALADGWVIWHEIQVLRA